MTVCIDAVENRKVGRANGELRSDRRRAEKLGPQRAGQRRRKSARYGRRRECSSGAEQVERQRTVSTTKEKRRTFQRICIDQRSPSSICSKCVVCTSKHAAQQALGHLTNLQINFLKTIQPIVIVIVIVIIITNRHHSFVRGLLVANIDGHAPYWPSFYMLV